MAPVWLFDHRYVLPPLPPAGVTVAVPLLPPLQETGVDDDDAVRTAGSLTVADAVAVQPLMSVTVTEYVPAARPVAVAVVWPFDHR